MVTFLLTNSIDDGGFFVAFVGKAPNTSEYGSLLSEDMSEAYT
jgi:hypothetical protein